MTERIEQDKAQREQSLALSGEGTGYFAAYKRRVLQRIVGREDTGPVLDFGCGTGDLLKELVHGFDPVHGYDPDPDALALAKKRVPGAVLFDDPEALPRDHYGAIVLANVMRHVPAENRPGLVRTVVQLLRKGGTVVFFEYNPLNPITRRVARAAPEGEGELLFPWEVRRMLKDAKLAKRHLEFIVFFPRTFAGLRAFEPLMSRVPIGAQVVGWGQRP
jgi:SAM-dependent methyltransferase